MKIIAGYNISISMYNTILDLIGISFSKNIFAFLLEEHKIVFTH